ncbi:SpoIIE family protein phosphatase [Amycolatopsis sp. PS_44_ISF1]|uniref:PP2C family protein-serine/threonine phosphatase n=1 Tax=Amycolatopsis sp. PS_44_ISF1 TaxID=2974917 RepID=UPI0028DD7A60|nr:SpoIIE family protein phosphatase [Amycolatopsis sp. PS_44_ISF1]MDT8913798.1 SpoIIE family protein phosphatase [Amycolatopsis sp. PS_44_ISF1]
MGPGGRLGSPGFRLRLLLIEDDDGDALLVEEMLADAMVPATLSRARTLAEALAGPVDADCVLLDLQLPDAMGLTGLNQLRRHTPGTAVVVLTGQNDATTGVAAVAAGAQDYLGKDQVDGLLLGKALRYAWERKRAEQVEQQLLQQQLLASENSRLERGLLPTPLLADPHLRLATKYRPGRNGSLLGGDFYDAIELSDGTVKLVIGDVCGHGPDEAALGVALRIAWRALVLAGLPTAEVLATVERVLVHERIRPLFATLCMVEVAPGRDSLRMSLAGHPPPLLATADGSGHLLPADKLGVPLGVVPDARWAPRDVALEPGWSLLLYTDGVFEGRVGAGSERLGHEQMSGLVLGLLREAGPDADHGEVLDRLVYRVEKLNAGALDDDVALAMLSHRSATPA